MAMTAVDMLASASGTGAIHERGKLLMVHIVLWLNILSFTLLFAGLGAEFLAWLRRREAWRALYLWYIGTYAFFSLLQTFAYFSVQYLQEPITGLYLAFGYYRSAISVVLIAVISRYIAAASGLRLGKAGRAALFIPAAVTATGIAALLAGGPAVLGAILNLAFNSAIALGDEPDSNGKLLDLMDRGERIIEAKRVSPGLEELYFHYIKEADHEIA